MFARAAALASRAIMAFSSASPQALMSQLAVGSSSVASTITSSPPLSLMASARRLMATNSTDIFNVHRDSPENNIETPIKISPEDMLRINEVVARYPPNYKASAVIPVLDLVQQMNGGWLSLTAMNKVRYSEDRYFEKSASQVSLSDTSCLSSLLQYISPR